MLTQPLLPFDTPQAFPEGFHLHRGYLSADDQQALLSDVRAVLAQAPLFRQEMPRTGAPLSVRMSNAGPHGWVSDRTGGYRFQGVHPETQRRWPDIPVRLITLWHDVTGEGAPPNQCLINYYDHRARLGLHQDKEPESLSAPVVSISLGDDATFVIGGLTRQSPKWREILRSGDVLWFGGPSRMIFHGIDGIIHGTSDLLSEGGRFNITLRRLDI